MAKEKDFDLKNYKFRETPVFVRKLISFLSLSINPIFRPEYGVK